MANMCTVLAALCSKQKNYKLFSCQLRKNRCEKISGKLLWIV